MKIKYIFYALILAILFYYVIGYFTNPKNANNHFVIAHDRTFHPLNLLGKEVDIEIFCDHLIEQIAKDQKISISIETVSYEHLQSGLQSGLFDAILVPVVEEWENVGQYYFSDPLFSLAPVLVIRTEETELSFEDFKGKSIGIVRSSPLMSRVNAIENITIAPYDKLFEGLESLLNDRIDGFIMDALQAYVYTEGFFKGKLRIFQPALTKAGIKLVTLQNPRSRAFVESFNDGLINLFKGSGYQILLENWGFDDYPLPPLKLTHSLSLDKPGV